MTTIVTDGKTVAADGLICYGQEKGAQSVRKIVVRTARDGKKRVFAFSGAHAMFAAVAEWFEQGAVPKDVPTATDDGWSMLVFEAHRNVNVFSTCPYPCEFSGVFGIGTGSSYAIGAVFAGASPEKGVLVASRLDRDTGGKIFVVNIAEALGIDVGVAEAAE